MAVIVLFDPMLIKGHLLKNPQNQDLFVYKVRLFWYFLLVLSLLTFVSVKHGLATLRYKSEAHKLAHKSYVTPLYLLVISGAGLLALGIKESNTLHMVFGVLSVAIGSNMLRFCRSKTSTPKRWLVEHLSAMIGSGIGAYTAFLTFGARQVNEDWGQFQLFVWIAPGVVGSIAIFFMSRKYTIRATKH